MGLNPSQLQLDMKCSKHLLMCLCHLFVLPSFLYHTASQLALTVTEDVDGGRWTVDDVLPIPNPNCNLYVNLADIRPLFINHNTLLTQHAIYTRPLDQLWSLNREDYYFALKIVLRVQDGPKAESIPIRVLV